MILNINISITPGETIYFCPSSLSFFNRIFALQNTFEPLILQWDSKSDSFYSRRIKPNKKCLIGFFNIYVISLLIGFGSCMIVLINPRKNSDIPHSLIITSIFVSACCLLLVASVTILVQFSSFIIHGFCSFDTFIHGLRGDAPNMRVNLPLHCPFGAECGPRFWMHVSNILVISVIGLMMIILVQPAAIYAKQDPFHVTIPMVFPFLLEYQWALFSLRLVLSLICVNEACRLFAFYLPKLVYLLELHFDLLNHLHQIPLDQPDIFLKWYIAYTIWDRLFGSYVPMMCGSLMGCGFMIFVISNVGVIKCYRILPLPNYLVMSFTAVFVFCIVYFSLPFAVHIAESTHFMITQRRTHFHLNMHTKVDKRSQKYLRRRLSGLKPVMISCGGLYPITRGSEVNYFFYVLLRTADVLLTTRNFELFKV